MKMFLIRLVLYIIGIVLIVLGFRLWRTEILGTILALGGIFIILCSKASKKNENTGQK